MSYSPADLTKSYYLVKALLNPRRVSLVTEKFGKFKRPIKYWNGEWVFAEIPITKLTKTGGMMRVYYNGWFRKYLLSEKPMSEVVACNGDTVALRYTIKHLVTS